jgi:TonB family protein
MCRPREERSSWRRNAPALHTLDIPVAFPAARSNNPVLASLWARERIDDLMSQDWAGLQHGKARPDIQKQIEQLGLDYHFVTQFTSFVAVEERVVTDGGQPKRIQVPVELPAGVQYEEGWWGGSRDKLISPQSIPSVSQSVAVQSSYIGGLPVGPPARTRSMGGAGGNGIGSGHGGGIGGGAYRVGGAVSAPREISATAPQYSEEARQANLQGTVVLWVMISPEGTVSDIRVQRSLGLGLDEKALEAVRTWKFEPAKKDGKPVPVQVNIEVTFGNGAAKSTVANTPAASIGAGKSTPSRKLDQKLHRSLVSLYDCRHRHECKVEGKPLINVVISGDEAAALKNLSALGFQLGSEQVRPHNFRGRIEVEKFEALAEIKFVKFVAPVLQQKQPPQ